MKLFANCELADRSVPASMIRSAVDKLVREASLKGRADLVDTLEAHWEPYTSEATMMASRPPTLGPRSFLLAMNSSPPNATETECARIAPCFAPRRYFHVHNAKVDSSVQEQIGTG